MRIAAPLNTEPVPELHWIEVATSLQLPSFQIIGLPAPEVAEARERVRAAIEASGLDFPRKRVVLNLSPASVRKRGAGMDLAMALAVLNASEGRERDDAAWAAWGELGLQGEVKPAGLLTRTLYAAWKAGVPRLILAREDRSAALERLNWLRESGELKAGLSEPEIYPVSTLAEAWELVNGTRALEPMRDVAVIANLEAREQGDDLTHLMALSPALERTIGIAAAGSHHLLLLGPRGTGKSHALSWLADLQPPMTPDIRLRHALLSELGAINPVAGCRSIVRRVGANARPASLIGAAGPLQIRPGEFSLAHGGLLVADEFMEWSRDCREALREPLERGSVTLTRVHALVDLPAQFVLAANGNLCPCGGWPPELPPPPDFPPEAAPRCRCSPTTRSSYMARLSGPILDRMEIVAIVASRPSGGAGEISGKNAEPVERHACLRGRVQAARERLKRFPGQAPGKMPSAEIDRLLRTHPKWAAVLDRIGVKSLRARHKILRVAFTISAWDGGNPEKLATPQLMEASLYRPERLGLCD